MKCESCVTLCQLRFFGATLAAARSVSLRQDEITPRRCEQQTRPDGRSIAALRTPLGRETRTGDRALYQSGTIRFCNNLQDRGDCQNTRNSYKRSHVAGWIVDWRKFTNFVAIHILISWKLVHP